jgi:hypothetical protein
MNTAFFVFVLVVLFINFLFLVRNQMVYNARMKLLREDTDAYLALPSYDEMLFRFWVPLSSYSKKKE